MALFTSPFYGTELYTPDQTPFKSLFRMLDEFDNYSRQQGPEGGEQPPKRVSAVRSFNPKFDVRETEEAYELYGELPGIEREHINIQFTEPQTVVISGRVQRSYTSGTPPAGLLEQGNHHATVEDAPAEGDNVEGKQVARKNNQEVKKTEKQQQQKQPVERYWLSERSIGEFSRTFGFPTRVEQEAVEANLSNGVLYIKVPKAKKQEARRIAIN